MPFMLIVIIIIIIIIYTAIMVAKRQHAVPSLQCFDSVLGR